MTIFYFQIFNFVLVVLGLAFVLRRGLGSYFKQQRDELDRKIKDAGARLKESQDQYEEIQRLMARYETTAAELRASSVRELDFQRTRLENEVSLLIQRSTEEAENKLRIEAESARAAIEKEVVTASLSLARKAIELQGDKLDGQWISELERVSQEAAGRKAGYAS